MAVPEPSTLVLLATGSVGPLDHGMQMLHLFTPVFLLILVVVAMGISRQLNQIIKKLP